MMLDNRIASGPAFGITRRLRAALEKKSEKFALRGYGHTLGGRIFITLFPAHAGVIPITTTLATALAVSSPRTRG